MTENRSLEQLCDAVNAWCEEHRVVPVSGQAGERLTERSVRYYRTLGLVEGPGESGYGEKHELQLTVVRLLQARGLPLRRIRELVYGRGLEELRTIRERGLAEQGEVGSSRLMKPMAAPGLEEVWRLIPLDDDFLLVSRRGTPVTAERQAAVLAALHAAASRLSQPIPT